MSICWQHLGHKVENLALWLLGWESTKTTHNRDASKKENQQQDHGDAGQPDNGKYPLEEVLHQTIFLGKTDYRLQQTFFSSKRQHGGRWTAEGEKRPSRFSSISCMTCRVSVTPAKPLQVCEKVQ